jgi:hypothetical protein
VGGGGTETQGTGSSNAGAMGLYDPNYDYGGSSGFDWGAIGTGVAKGLGQFGKSLSGGAPYTSPQLTGVKGLPELTIYQSRQPPPVGSSTGSIGSAGGGGSQDMAALLRLFLGMG